MRAPCSPRCPHAPDRRRPASSASQAPTIAVEAFLRLQTAPASSTTSSVTLGWSGPMSPVFDHYFPLIGDRMNQYESFIDVAHVEPIALARAALVAYAQLRLDVILLAANTPTRNAVTEVANKCHRELAEAVGLDPSALTVLMAQLFLTGTWDDKIRWPGGEDSSG